MILDNTPERNAVLREHAAMITQLQVMYDAIGISKGVAGERITFEALDKQRSAILAHAESHGITTAEMHTYHRRFRRSASSVSDAVKKLSES